MKKFTLFAFAIIAIPVFGESHKAIRAWSLKDNGFGSLRSWYEDDYIQSNIIAHMIVSFDAVGEARVGKCPIAIAAAKNAGTFYEGAPGYVQKKLSVLHLTSVYDSRWCYYQASPESALVFEVESK